MIRDIFDFALTFLEITSKVCYNEGYCKALKLTEYFLHMRQRPDRAKIKMEWIEETIKNPIYTEVQSDGRIRKWKKIKEENKFLRVILLADGETVHNAFFDRSFRKKTDESEVFSRDRYRIG